MSHSMQYAPVTLPFKVRQLSAQLSVAVSNSGDHAFLSAAELDTLRTSPTQLPIRRQAELSARFFLGRSSSTPGMQRLLLSRVAARRETVETGPSLHIIVPTLQCAHSCRYCQVSRSLLDDSHALSPAALDMASDAIFESPSPTLTVEYQGGDPLIRFDLVRHSIERIASRNLTERRRLRFVIASTLHQLTDEMAVFMKAHDVYLSTSLDGPPALHNANRPTPARNAYERTVAGIELARQHIGFDHVSALMTTTKLSLQQPEAIVDEYVRLGFRDIFLRPLSFYGFAKRNQALLGYQLPDFQRFYQRAFERILHWNRQGVPIREVYAGIILNKLLSTFDAGYVDLQSPTGAGRSVLVYNYDGFVYPSDEARMLAETGDTSLRMGPIGTPLDELQASPVMHRMTQASMTERSPACQGCAYALFCAPNPVDAQAQYGDMETPAEHTDHCQRHLWLFDRFMQLIQEAQAAQKLENDPWLLDLLHDWAMPRTVPEGIR